MGSDIHILVPEEQASIGLRTVETLFEEWEAALSRFRPESELSRLNGRAGRPIVVGPILLAAVEAAVAAARATGGLFDPTLGRDLVRIGYDRTFEDLRDVGGPPLRRGHGGGAWRAVVVDRSTHRVTLPAGAALDVGGIAKGMAVDASLALLSEHGIERALVSAGGDLAVLGLPPGRRAWAIRVGGGPDGQVVPLVRGALATSGTARRRWAQGALRRHHLVDPATGEPAVRGLAQVTVAGATCRAAEVGATAAFVAGPRLGPGLLARLGLAGLLVADSGDELLVGRWPRPELGRAA
jgi:FAD:protein FMN transferase